MLLDGTDQISNIFNFKVTARVASTDLSYMQSIALFLDDLWVPINDEMTDQMTYIDVDGINITKDELLPSVDWTTLTVGTAAAKLLPAQVAVCVFFRTTRPKTRASKFVGGWTSNALDTDGTISAAVLALMQTFGDALVTGISESGDEADYGAYNQPLDRFTSVDNAVIPVHYRTQRRRRQGVGS